MSELEPVRGSSYYRGSDMNSARHDRTVRLLAAELEAVALAGERASLRACDIETQILRLATATRNAVTLEVISVEEADRIWTSAVEQHPLVAWRPAGPPLAA